MPQLNGYQIYESVSKNPQWRYVPFIFLSGLIDPENIRYAKRLGIDDYLTKPFEKEDLLAIIYGKLKKYNSQKTLMDQMKIVLNDAKIFKIKPSLTEMQKNEVILIMIGWDDYVGPEILLSTPSLKYSHPPLDQISAQLFTTSTAVFGCGDSYKSESLLFRLVNLEKDCYILFDTPLQPEPNSGRQLLLLTLIAPKITYLDSLKLKNKLISTMDQFKHGQLVDFSTIYQDILNELLSDM
jgi:CheY-like chemotaxis protein